MRYDFEWDIRKAKSNFRKHKINFERATTIFHDPNILSIPDENIANLRKDGLQWDWMKTGYYL